MRLKPAKVDFLASGKSGGRQFRAGVVSTAGYQGLACLHLFRFHQLSMRLHLMIEVAAPSAAITFVIFQGSASVWYKGKRQAEHLLSEAFLGLPSVGSLSVPMAACVTWPILVVVGCRKYHLLHEVHSFSHQKEVLC